MQTMNTREFLFTFKDIHENSHDRRFCFILGAGASRSSGIPTGATLADQWLKEIKERLGEEDENYTSWLSDKNIDVTSPALHYSDIFDKRYSYDVQSGYDYINKIMANARPEFGYAVLAQLLSNFHHNIIITTNFDNLIEEALYTYTDKRPLVCGHESLASFAKKSLNRPLLVKIHRDRFFDPINSKQGTSTLHSNWVNALNNIFRDCIPVFMGYGGNDGSLMTYLEDLQLNDNFFWCEVSEPNERVKKLITKHNGKLVKIEGFDEFMFHMQDLLKLELMDEKIIEVAKNRASNYRRVVDEMNKKKVASSNKEDKEAVKRLAEKKENKDWWYWQLKASSEADEQKREDIYLEGLKEFPDNAQLIGAYAFLLHYNLKQYDKAETLYLKALAIDPKDAVNNENYANFLKEIRADHDAAEQHYLQALAMDPNNAIYNGNYAIFLHFVRLEYDKAEQYYLDSLQGNPNSSPNLGGYATLLKDVRKNFKKAEEYYLKALELSPNDPYSNVNYALLLHYNLKDYDKAEEHYQRALAVDNHAINNINYAFFLHYIRRDFKAALPYYQEALQADPENALYKIHYATLLKMMGKPEEADPYFKDALSRVPKDANYNGIYTWFLFSEGRLTEAEPYLHKALELNKDEHNSVQVELLFYQYALTAEKEKSLKALKSLLCEGIRSTEWNLDDILQQAEKTGHPDMPMLKRLAGIIVKNDPTGDLCS